MEDTWLRFIQEVEGGPAPVEPAWFGQPAVSQLAITSPAIQRPFLSLNAGQEYPYQIKPFGFMLVAHADPLEPLPAGFSRDRLVPVAPYSADPDEYLRLPWVNRYDGRRISVVTTPGGAPGRVRVRTFRDVINGYRLHPELKSGDPRGGPCVRSTRGLLPRRPVFGTEVRHIGKESNRLDEVQDGLIQDAHEVYVEYPDPLGRWRAALPRLRGLRDRRGVRYLATRAQASERTIQYALNGGRVPQSADPGEAPRTQDLR